MGRLSGSGCSQRLINEGDRDPMTRISRVTEWSEQSHPPRDSRPGPGFQFSRWLPLVPTVRRLREIFHIPGRNGSLILLASF